MHCKAEAKSSKIFLVLFFKKEQESKHFFLKKEAKTSLHGGSRNAATSGSIQARRACTENRFLCDQ
jgi:hypothetical protein